MKTFLNNISQLDSIHDVFLLSSQGELLFCNQQKNQQTIDNKIRLLRKTINNLNKPATTELLFSKGRYYLNHISIGYLIVGMSTDKNLARVRSACKSVQKKLTDPNICKNVLLKMVSEADDRLKPHFIKELVPLADKEVARTLILLLQQEALFQPEIRDKLLLYICQTLGHCSSLEAITPLKKLLSRDQADNTDLNSDLEKAVQRSIKQLELEDIPSPAKPAKTVTPVKDYRPRVSNLPGAQQIKELLNNEQKGDAISLIMQFIESCARDKQFDKAEQLRNWLIQIDSSALMEIIRAAEIIEEKKKSSIDSEQFLVWKELTNILSPEEFSSLYHSMTAKSYSSGEMIARQGESLSTLFFINSGRVQLHAVTQGKEIPLKTLGQGEIIGAGTLFEISVWTINAKSMGGELLLLPRKKLQQLEDSYPALESKLVEFCSRFQPSSAIFQKTNRTRRQFERKNLSGRTAIALLDRNGQDTGIGAKGDLLDISKGGVSFCLRFSKKEKALKLFRHKIKVSLPSAISANSLLRRGAIVAVRSHDLIGNEYSIHVEFDKELTNTEMQQTVSAGQV